MDTKALEKFCPWARIELIDAVHLRCVEFGLDDKGRAAFPAGSDMVAGNVLGPELKALRDAHYESIEHMGYAAFLEHQAYSWFNRFAAIRYLELHDFLPNHIRMVSSSTGNMYPDCVHAVAELELEGLNRAEAIDLAIAGENEKLYRSIILAQCKELAQALPSVFAGADELTLPNNLLGHGEHDVLHHLVADIPEKAWENVEVLGWMYQFYNSELKDAFFKSKHKAMAEDIPPATQLFTPDWIVRYMVENSLGRLWMLNNPGSRLRERMEYYIEPDEGHEDFIRVNGPEDITFCDPACGSGHILVYAFSLLFDMYLERGYRERDIPELILTRNLAGLEIDERAAQIASLALALCARAHDRRFFTRGVTADVRVLGSIEIDVDALAPASALREHPKLLEALARLSEVGSLLHPSPEDMGALKAELMRSLSGDLFVSHTQESIARAAETCEALARTFDVVVANPPYMGSSSFNPFMGKWMKANYPDEKGDLCFAFISRICNMKRPGGEAGITATNSWMFLSSSEASRLKVLAANEISSLVQLSVHGFKGIAAQVFAFTLIDKQPNGYKGGYVRLSDFDHHSLQEGKTLEAIRNPDCGWFYRSDAATFHDIPGSPIAYWASDAVRSAFCRCTSLGSIANVRQGLRTGDNNRFLRLWWEIGGRDFNLSCSSNEEALASGSKWFPHNKGGEFRKWYGNNDYVIRFDETAYLQLCNSGNHLPSKQFYFMPSVTWSTISSGRIAFRYKPRGHLFDGVGNSIFADQSELLQIQGALNSSSINSIAAFISPTLSFEAGQVAIYPVIESPHHHNRICSVVGECRELSQADWDTQETSWDFKRNPLI